MSPLALSLRLLQAQPDERLLVLAKDGHELAFEALVRRYRKPLLAYCRRITPGSAEDVLQQALLQAWGALGAGAEVTEARAWLYRIVHNAAISAVRNAPQAPDVLVDAVAPSGLEQLVEQRLAAREALAHLAALPGLQREVMLGSALEGRSHEELAAELGLSGGSVRGLIYRARATLRATAAALIPSPLADWAIRCTVTTPTGSGYQALAGGSSVGVAGLLIKGGTAATLAGALAGAAAIVTTHSLHHHAASRHARPVVMIHPPTRAQPNSRVILASAASAGAVAERGATSPTPSGRSTSATGQATVGHGAQALLTLKRRAEVRRPSRTRTQPVDRTHSGATGSPEHTSQPSGSGWSDGSGATTANVAPPGAATPTETTDTTRTSSTGTSTGTADSTQPSSTDAQPTATGTSSTNTASTGTTSTGTPSSLGG